MSLYSVSADAGLLEPPTASALMKARLKLVRVIEAVIADGRPSERIARISFIMLASVCGALHRRSAAMDGSRRPRVRPRPSVNSTKPGPSKFKEQEGIIVKF